jgi:protease-4
MRYLDRIRERKRKSRRSLDVIVRAVATGIFIASLFLNVLFLAVIVLIAAAGAVKERTLEEAGYRKVYSREYASSPRGAGSELAVIPLSGFISDRDTGGSFFGYTENSVSAVVNRLNLIRKDREVKGVLLLVDSPGGGVTASDVIYHAVREFKAETGLPVVTLMKGTGASGAYYVASASDYIVAYPTTITGSIGVILFSFNVKGLMDKYGVKYVTIKSGGFKDLISPFKGVDDEELAWMQRIVDRMNEQFVSAVAEGRKNLSYGQVKKLSDGKIYIADEALKAGLIDKVGYFRDAVNALAERAGVVSPNVVEYQREKGLRDMFRVSAHLFKPRSVFDLAGMEGELGPYGLYFLWEGAGAH